MRLFRNQMLFFLCLLLALVFVTPTISAQEGERSSVPTLILQPNQPNYSLGLHLEILQDTTKKLTMDQVSSEQYNDQFVPSTESIPNFGLTSDAYWVRFQLKNSISNNAQWLLEIGAPSLNYVDAYIIASPEREGDNRSYTVKPSIGTLRPFNNREVDYHRLIYKLNLNPFEVQQIYLRFESAGVMILPLTIWQVDAFASYSRQDQFLGGIFYGILFVMIGYNLFLFFSLKDKSYLYLTSFIAAHLMLSSVLDGRASQYLSFNTGQLINSTILLLGGLILLSMLQFTISFLSTKQHTPHLHNILTIFQITTVMVICLIPFVHFAFIALVWLLFVFPATVFILLAAGRTWRQGFFPARHFLLAFPIQMAATILTTLIRLDIVPSSPLFDRIEQFGLVVAVLLLSFGLADRINLLQASTESANFYLRESQNQLTTLLTEREALLKREKRQRIAAETLGEVTLALTSQTDLNKTLDEILQQAQRLSAYSAAHIALLDGDVLRVSHWRGYERFNNVALINELVQPIDDFPLDLEMIQAGQSLIYSDTHNDPKWVIVKETAWIRSHLAMPIVLQERVLGLLRLDGEVAGQFKPEDMERLSPLVSAAAIALENARLFGEEQQRSQAYAQARDQALQASHLKSELLAKVSHELRTPLGAILGFSQILRKGVYGNLSQKQLAINDEIIDSTEYLTNLVNELLDQAQLDAGRLKLNTVALKPQSLMADLETKMSVLAKAKTINLKTTVDTNLPETIWVDPNRLQQILVNLVGNAIKFTEKGLVEVRFTLLNPDYWSIIIKDTGIGIPYQDQAYIFEPFYQVDGSATRTHKGTGLGLSIVQQLVSLMAGEIQLESTPGQGTTFTLTLPMKVDVTQEQIK